MDPFKEVERLAKNANTSVKELKDADILRWQKLFGFSFAEAKDELMEFRENLFRAVHPTLWAVCRTELEAQGHNQESYEYQLLTQKDKSKSVAKLEKSTSRENIFFKIEEPLNEHHLHEILTQPPYFKKGSSEDEADVLFCQVNNEGKDRIELWFAKNKIFPKPTFVRISLADKDLSQNSIYRTLGKEATLPHYRLDSHERIMPHQTQYTFFYFFYGTLMDKGVLSRTLDLAECEIELQPAVIKGGKIRTWAQKYKALIDASNDDVIEGFAFEVKSAEQEESLRLYETAKYEVVRCEIQFIEGSRTVMGCTFLFVDPWMLA